MDSKKQYKNFNEMGAVRLTIVIIINQCTDK